MPNSSYYKLKGLLERRWITSFTRPVQVSHRGKMFMAIRKHLIYQCFIFSLIS